MIRYKQRAIGNIVAEDYRTAEVFDTFGLDFCCGGRQTVEEACDKEGIDPEEVLSALEKLKIKRSDHHNYNEWSLDFLIDYIINNHHHYVRKKLPEIRVYGLKVANAHGKKHPELIGMQKVFLKLKNDIFSHLDKEEQVLFPYIKKLVQGQEDGELISEKPAFGEAANPVRTLLAQHEEAGGDMVELESLSNGFTPPQDACTTFRLYFKNLKAFREDLHKHIHLENNILFPKALELERRLSSDKVNANYLNSNS